jgi:hypothetical protein
MVRTNGNGKGQENNENYKQKHEQSYFQVIDGRQQERPSGAW